MKPQCVKCRFFCHNPNVPTSGDCRKNPPVVIQESHDRGAAGMQFFLTAVWPCVQVDEWCGEFTEEK